MIMPRKKPKRVLRWLTQAQFRMGKIRAKLKYGIFPAENPPRGIPPPRVQWRLQVTHKAVGGSYWRLEGRLQVVGGQAKA